jgi:thiamine biosynthesis lipoprotein
MVLVNKITPVTLTSRAPGLRRVEQVMGTSIHLDIRDPFPDHRLTALADEVFGWFRQVDALFSTHRAESQVSLLDHGMLRPIQADPLVREVLHTCALLHERTYGYFNIHATGKLDPSQYVTGWALQRASATLTKAGATNHRLQADGNLYTAGLPQLDQTWFMRIQDPLHPDRSFWTIPTTDVPAASSTLTDRKHIYDPVARCRATELASVTVTGPNLGITNAYATAAFAMGLAALDWLPQLHDHHYAVVDDQGRCHENMPAIMRD